MSTPIRNNKPQLSDEVMDGLAEVIGQLVNKAIEEKLPAAIETVMNKQQTNGKPLINQRPVGGFKLPRSEGHKAPEGE